MVDSRRCLPQLREDPKFLWFLCNHIARRSARQSTVLTIQQAYPLKNQLAAFLLMASEGDCYRQRHTEAAEYLGVSYRHLLYVLAQFRKEGLIRREGPEYRILDRAPGGPGGGVRKNARYLPSCPCFFGGLWCIIRIFYGLR